MPAYNFQKEFAQDVESGKKRQTIRPRRKRPTAPGDTLMLYTGQRTKSCRLLCREKCKSVEPILILSGGGIKLDRHLTNIEKRELAKADGFETLDEFYEWFDKRYGLPFNGELIKW